MRETPNNKSYKICFIIGSIIGFVAVACYIYASIMVMQSIWVYLNYPSNAAERFDAAIAMMVALAIALYIGIVIAVAIVFVCIGIKWNKKAGISVLSVIIAAVLLMLSCVFVWKCCPPAESSYSEKEVGDFVVWVYDDYCEIYGTTEAGNNKKYLVIPEYIDGVRVDALGVRSLAGAIDMVSGDVTYPRIESDVIEKIYFESAIDFYPWLNPQNISVNFKKLFYPGIEKYPDATSSFKMYYPRAVYEKAVQDEIWSTYSVNKHPANISYYYNYEGAENDGYYWIDDCDYGEKIEYIPKNPERRGYTFGGWYKEPECINEWDFEVDTLPEEKKEEKEVHVNEETVKEEVTVYQETILYAKWV